MKMYGIDEKGWDIVKIEFWEEGDWKIFFVDWKIDSKSDGEKKDGTDEDMGFGLFDWTKIYWTKGSIQAVEPERWYISTEEFKS